MLERKGLVAIACLLLATACQGAAEKAGEAASNQGSEVANDATVTNGAVPGVSPSFDCAKASSETETMVCGDPHLAQLDNEIARLYKLAENTPQPDRQRMQELRATQRGWIKGRNECWKADDKRACIVDAYASRIMYLRQGYANSRTDDDAGISTGPFALACKGLDFGIGVVFVRTEPSIAHLQWLDSSVTVTSEISGSGVKYTGSNHEGRYQLWTKGMEAMLTMPGRPETQCQIEEIG